MSSVQLGGDLQDLYENYYGDDFVEKKRVITAMQSLAHIRNLVPETVNSIVDVGSGQGSLVEMISKAGMANRITALEISASGVEITANRNLANVTAKKFDGYTAPCQDKEFDLAVCIHVLEHVEHERAFLREIKRISRRAIVEVPLECNLNFRKNREIMREYGHINFYTQGTFQNLLETSGLKVTRLGILDYTVDYMKFIDSRFGGIKHFVRGAALHLWPSVAAQKFNYLGVALCECR